ncbi:hypothetical protein FACS189452_00220 [Bacteroidia bacterium]|nr:hypothetical protein FACS189452_00220 [Bacteroidia bacterium]GHT80317.1 hypothetical protein FACS189467_2190 [Bacteroidia bacterium]
MVLQFLWLYIDDLVGKGLDTLVVVELISYAAANLIPMVLPLSMLLTSIMTMGGLGEHNELLALKASGISLARIMSPLFVIAALFSISSFVFSNNILPYTNLKFTSLLFSVKQQRPEMQIKAGVFYDGIEGYVIKVDSKDEETSLLHNVIIYNHNEQNGNKSLTIADSGYLRITSNQQYLIFTLYNGNVYEELKESGGTSKYPFRINHFEEQESVFELIGYGFERSDETLFKNRSQMLNLQQLSAVTDSLKKGRNASAQQQFNNFFHSSHFAHNQELDKPDSIYSLQYPHWLTQDSLLQLLSIEKISNAAARALQKAREAKSEIVTQVDYLHSDSRQINLHNIQWHLKFTYPLACLIFFFIGAPLGAIIRKGGFGTPFVVSLLIFLVYYVISISCQKIARDGAWSAALAMWTSSMITFPIGLFLTYKAAKDQRFTLPKWYLQTAEWVKQFFVRKT